MLDQTAYTLNQGELRLGLIKSGVGILDELEVATYTLPWVLGPFVETVIPNVELKAMVYDRRRLALSVTAGFATGSVRQRGSIESVRVFVAPLAFTSSVRINHQLRLHAGVRYGLTSSKGEIRRSEEDARGALILDVLQVWLKQHIRLSHITALTLSFRYVPYAGDRVATGSVTLDEITTTSFRLSVDQEAVRNLFAAIVGVELSWRILNLKFAVGYGSLFLDSLGLVVELDRRYPYPLFDVFVRF